MELKNKDVFLIAATSSDGFISPLDKIHESSTKWTSREDAKFFSQTTKDARVVVYGSKTYQTIPNKYRPLAGRINIIYSRTPKSLDIQLLTDAKSLSLGAAYSTDLPPAKLIKHLNDLGHHQVAICGGHSIYELFISSGVVNRVYQTIEPIIFNNGVPFLTNESSAKLRLTGTIPLSESTNVKVYDVIK